METSELLKVDNVFEVNKDINLLNEPKDTLLDYCIHMFKFLAIMIGLSSILILFMVGLIYLVSSENSEKSKRINSILENASLEKMYIDDGKILASLSWNYVFPDKLVEVSQKKSIYGEFVENVNVALNDKLTLNFNNLSMNGIYHVKSENCKKECNYVVKKDNGSLLPINRMNMSNDFENYSLMEYEGGKLINEYPLKSLKEYNLNSFFYYNSVAGEDFQELSKQIDLNSKNPQNF